MENNPKRTGAKEIRTIYAGIAAMICPYGLNTPTLLRGKLNDYRKFLKNAMG